MSIDDIARVRGDFVKAAIRAQDALVLNGWRLHFAHGYLAQSFSLCMPISVQINMVAIKKAVVVSYLKP